MLLFKRNSTGYFIFYYKFQTSIPAKNEGKPFTIVFTSDMGLCGGYNANIYRMLSSEIGNDGQFVMIGSRGVNWSKNKDLKLLEKKWIWKMNVTANWQK